MTPDRRPQRGDCVPGLLAGERVCVFLSQIQEASERAREEVASAVQAGLAAGTRQADPKKVAAGGSKPKGMLVAMLGDISSEEDEE